MQDFKTDEEELAWFVGLVEGEGSFHIRTENRTNKGRSQGSFALKMTDRDVIQAAQATLKGWGIDLNMRLVVDDRRGKNGIQYKPCYCLASYRAEYLKIIIDKCYPFFSEKKQGDCDRVLKNLADRGLL